MTSTPPGPLEVLEDLLAQPWEVGADEGEFSVYFESSSSPDERLDFLARFDRTVQAVEERWGPANFRGLSDGEAVFPAWAQDTSIALAYWERGDRLAYVRLEHADETLPYAVVLGVLEG